MTRSLERQLRKVGMGVALAAALGALAATPAHAQGRVRFGLGGTGDFGLESGQGSRFGGMVLADIGARRRPLGLRLDFTLLRGQSRWSEVGTGALTWTFHTPLSIFHPYLLAGGGVYHAPDFTHPMAKFGGGLDYHVAHRNRGTVLFLEPTFNLIFAGSDAGGTFKSIQLNLGLKFGD
ncbi:MAG TPA: hypothetical protein VFS40_09355 [Gemmatimonadales bacterium]|nr:hypothetical protein [Gemmatimonadales bacterium]